MDIFGTDVTYTPSVGDPVTVKGVFSNGYIEVPLGNGVATATSGPTLGVKLDDLPVAPSQATRITIGGVTYRINHSEEDGQGGALLILSKV